jgi:SHS2 domain-containing protein
MMKPYRFIDDLTSDVMFEARGKTLNQVFANAAIALFDVIAQVEKVKAEKSVRVTVKGLDLEDLMFNWLQELITLVDTHEMFFSRFDVKVDEKTNSLEATCYGEEAKAEKSGTLVKAVTYYKYKFEKIKNGYRVNAALDI